jgi:hypothetical protein
VGVRGGVGGGVVVAPRNPPRHGILYGAWFNLI